MKLIIALLIIFSPISLIHSQCVCDTIVNQGKPEIIVSSVQELQSALTQANQQGGNLVILLEDGVYELSQNLLYINEGMNNLTIRGKSGNRDEVILRGQGMNGNVGYIFNVAADHFTCADMTIGWVGNHAIQIHAEHDADSCIIQNVRFVDVNEQMLKVSGSSASIYSDAGIVQCCSFEFPSGQANQWYTGGIDAHKARDWIVRNNEFRNIISPESQLAEHAIHFWSLSDGTLVEQNTIINCDRGIGFGLTADPDRGHLNGVIRNNFVHTSRDVGIGLENARNTQTYHNTVITENYFNSIEYRFDSTYNNWIVNNLVTENISSRNNGSASVTHNFKVQDFSVFEDVDAYDFHLTGSYPGITDSGTTIQNPGLDIDCESRPFTNPDIGADELITTSILVHGNGQKVMVYPHLFTNLIYVDSPGGDVMLSDLSGKKVLETHLQAGTVRIDIPFTHPGIYILVFRNGDKVITEKLIRI